MERTFSILLTGKSGIMCSSSPEFNRYTNSPVACYKDELYNLPFNMNTFSKMWGIRTPAEAKEIIEAADQGKPGSGSQKTWRSRQSLW